MLSIRTAIREDAWDGLLAAWPCIGARPGSLDTESP
jgi:hypothetical protein